MGAVIPMDVFEQAGVIAGDPARLGWPATLPIEIALKTAPLAQIKDEYGYTDVEWEALRHDPVFLADLAQAVATVKQDGMSFKLKAKLQAEEILKTSWKMIHDSTGATPSSVRADLIKSTMRWAGYDNKDAASAAGGQANALQININLGG